MREISNYAIIFDNGGGTTLQLHGRYGHYYDDPKHAANDLLAYLKGSNLNEWEGNEQESIDLTPSDNDIANGEYRLVCDIRFLDSNSSWENEKEFTNELRK
jgi:hypothetical protein